MPVLIGRECEECVGPLQVNRPDMHYGGASIYFDSMLRDTPRYFGLHRRRAVPRHGPQRVHACLSAISKYTSSTGASLNGPDCPGSFWSGSRVAASPSDASVQQGRICTDSPIQMRLFCTDASRRTRFVCFRGPAIKMLCRDPCGEAGRLRFQRVGNEAASRQEQRCA